MSPTLQALGIDRLSIEDRLALVQAIWDSIAAEPHPPLLTEAQRQELERRMAAHRADPSDVIPWEQVKAEALAGIPVSVEGQEDVTVRSQADSSVPGPSPIGAPTSADLAGIPLCIEGRKDGTVRPHRGG